jgi:hypothetical protein
MPEMGGYEGLRSPKQSELNFRDLFTIEIYDLLHKKADLTQALSKFPDGSSMPPHYARSFFGQFKKAFDLAGLAIEDKDLRKQLKYWFENARIANRADNKLGLKLAEAFLEELVNKDMFTLFEEPTKPPFLPLIRVKTKTIRKDEDFESVSHPLSVAGLELEEIPLEKEASVVVEIQEDANV